MKVRVQAPVLALHRWITGLQRPAHVKIDAAWQLIPLPGVELASI
jgi:hypothetical protein